MDFFNMLHNGWLPVIDSSMPLRPDKSNLVGKFLTTYLGNRVGKQCIFSIDFELDDVFFARFHLLDT